MFRDQAKQIAGVHGLNDSKAPNGRPIFSHQIELFFSLYLRLFLYIFLNIHAYIFYNYTYTYICYYIIEK